MITSRNNSKQRFRKLKKVAKRLAAYSAAAAATLMTTQNRSANAGEVVHDILDVTVGPTSSQQVVFDMVAGTTQGIFSYGTGHQTQGVMRLMGYYMGYPSPFFYAPFSASTVTSAFVGTGTSNAATLGPSATIGAADNFVRYHHPTYSGYGYYANLGNWSVGQRAFVGIRFALPTGTHFGWAEVTRNDTKEVTLHGFGYNDTPNAATVIPSVTTADILTLETNDLTGEITIHGSGLFPVSFDFYQIISGSGGNANALTPDTWNSLQNQDTSGAADVNGDGKVDGDDLLEWQTSDGTPEVLAAWEANYGTTIAIGSGWEESGGVSANALGEIYLLGSTTIPAGGSISLGEAYDETAGGPAKDVTFTYRTASGAIFEGSVVITTTPPIAGGRRKRAHSGYLEQPAGSRL